MPAPGRPEKGCSIYKSLYRASLLWSILAGVVAFAVIRVLGIYVERDIPGTVVTHGPFFTRWVWRSIALAVGISAVLFRLILWRAKRSSTLIVAFVLDSVLCTNALNILAVCAWYLNGPYRDVPKAVAGLQRLLFVSVGSLPVAALFGLVSGLFFKFWATKRKQYH